MIVMINGAFGSGKTSTAYMLQSFISNSMIFDLEEIGYMLRKLVPEHLRDEHEQTDDFQDMDLWKVLTVQTAKQLKQKYNKHLIIPMTIYKIENFTYIVNGLREIDRNLHHFCLIASEETIQQRLAKRGDELGGWTYQNTPKCVSAFNDQQFHEHIVTDELRIEEIVDIIIEKLSINV